MNVHCDMKMFFGYCGYELKSVYPRSGAVSSVRDVMLNPPIPKSIAANRYFSKT